jgi:hypothetical protein
MQQQQLLLLHRLTTPEATSPSKHRRLA